jgi:UDP-N-acetylglucosamine 4-epimerase
MVTGGAGFIGSHIATALVERGETVRIVDNFSTGSRANIAHLAGRVDVREISINDLDGVREAMKGVDYVLHQAALPSVPRSVDDPVTTHHECTTGTLYVLLTARDAGVKRVVYAASSSAYGDTESQFKHEDMAPRPISPYAVAKLAGEMYCQSFTRVYGLETVALRYFNVFGPRQDPYSEYSAVIPLFMLALLKGNQPTIYGDGLQSRDFTFVDNVVAGNLLACHAPSPVAGEVMNVACGEKITLLELVAALNKLMGTSIEPIFAPARPGDIKHSCADINKAGRLLGYEPQVRLEEGLARTLEWFRTQERSH